VRLTQAKLAGFKSFVDPTSIPVPGQLVAVVGPNGCGKSNVIDAVRWVLGESSARQLRGESMQDVIFNGSDRRKPVSRARWSCCSTTASGALPASGRNTPKSRSSACSRARANLPITSTTSSAGGGYADLFLGTGVGTRGYAVIEQGMISRIIEARPEELRVFLEEAAGVSKYKERRKETESRIRDTRDNLTRVEDIRDRTRFADGAPRGAGRRRAAVSRIQRRTDAQAATALAVAAQRRAGERERLAREVERAVNRTRSAERRAARNRSAARGSARSAFLPQRRRA
jgi:chromosome segregation protein